MQRGPKIHSSLGNGLPPKVLESPALEMVAERLWVAICQGVFSCDSFIGPDAPWSLLHLYNVRILCFPFLFSMQKSAPDCISCLAFK